MAIERLDSRRLTGPNVHCASAGAVAEVRFDGLPEPAIARWRAHVTEGAAELGWSIAIHVREFLDAEGRAGAELMFTAPVDQLYAATELNEWAIARAAGVEAENDLATVADHAAAERAQRAGALALIERAEREGVDWLLDDDALSLGYFDDAQTFVFAEGPLPGPEAIDWTGFRRHPVVVLTGTNGKTTTTRLLARLVRRAGLRVGNTSTDGLCVDEVLVEAGDWTGPGGARAVLRHPGLDVALLEAARGGLLRRGLGVRSPDVAVITNVDRDHLGEYGVFDLAGMAAAKGIVARAAKADGKVILGADSPALVDWAARALPDPGEAAPSAGRARVVWFSLDPDSPVLLEHRRTGGETWTVEGGWMVCHPAGGGSPRKLVPVADIPLTLDGHARHNVANALAAAAAAHALGLEDRAVVTGLLEFGARPEDNPGRAHLWTVPRDREDPAAGSVDLLVDFAHNLAGLTAIQALVARDGRRPILSFAMAGDRSDEDLLALGAALREFEPRSLVLREQVGTLRGRPLGEVPTKLAAGYGVGPGDGAGAVTIVEDEPSALDFALADSAPGDLVVLLVHTERDAVAAWLSENRARPRG